MLGLELADLRVEQQPELVGLDLAVNDRPQRAAQKLDGVVVAGKAGIFFEHRTFRRLQNVFLQGDHAVAAAEQKQFVKHFQQIFVGGAVVRRTLETGAHALDDVEQHFFRRHDDERAGRAAGDDQHGVDA